MEKLGAKKNLGFLFCTGAKIDYGMPTGIEFAKFVEIFIRNTGR